MSITGSGVECVDTAPSRRNFIKIGAAGLAGSTMAAACRTGAGNADPAAAASVKGLVGDGRKRRFSVVRIKRDLLRRSSVSLMATGRREANGGAGNHLACGVDGAFAFYSNVRRLQRGSQHPGAQVPAGCDARIYR